MTAEKEYMNAQQIEERYQELCNTASDINEHLPILKEYAEQCVKVTELGVRGCVSLYAFLSAFTVEKVVAVDILNVWTPPVAKLEFICADDLTIEIEQTEFLFIDTLHNYKHCIQELTLHAHKVDKYIGFHDTDSNMFGVVGDDGGKGLLFAIYEFLNLNKKWHLDYHNNKNNGLTILKKYQL